MAKKPTKQKNRILYNGTPFTKERFTEIKNTMSQDEDLKIIWMLFENTYGSFMKESFQELITTQKFLIEFMTMLRESAFLNEQEDSLSHEFMEEDSEESGDSLKTRGRRKQKSVESDFIDTLSKCIKSLQTVNEVIYSMRNTMVSSEDIEEIKTVASESISIIDQLANERRKK